jgi:hypothetical protein
MDKSDAIWHMIRYGTHSEQRYFTEHEDCYNVLVFSANLVAFTPGGIASLVVGKVKDKKYIIDPLTHAFAHSPTKIMKETEGGNFEPKASIQSLIQYYGNPIVSKVQARKSVTPSDFSDDAVCREFTHKVLEFQNNVLNDQLKKSDFAKYLEEEQTSPHLLIAPYFYMTSLSYKPWVDLNLKFISLARQIVSAKPLFAELVISQDVLTAQEILKDIVSRYGDSDCDGIFIWVDGFAEQTASKEMLNNFNSLLKGLTQKGKKIYNLYSGYYSILCCAKGLLSGVCHGLQYGEDREVVPVGGGIPRAKFYLPGVHSRLRYGDVAYSIRVNNWNTVQKYQENICNCKVCKENIREDVFRNFARFGTEKRIIARSQIGNERTLSFATQESKDLCTRHYLEIKKKEFDDIQTQEFTTLLRDLVDNHKRFEDSLGIETVGHLNIWADVLRSIGA